jgi:hypothetical protein
MIPERVLVMFIIAQCRGKLILHVFIRMENVSSLRMDRPVHCMASHPCCLDQVKGYPLLRKELLARNAASLLWPGN